MISQRTPLREGDGPLKQAARIDHRQDTARFSSEAERLDMVGPDHQGGGDQAARALVQSQNPERVVVEAGEQGVDISVGPKAHLTPQTSVAYSEIVRSDENQPMLAVLRTAIAVHCARSRQTRSICRWAAM